MTREEFEVLHAEMGDTLAKSDLVLEKSANNLKLSVIWINKFRDECGGNDCALLIDGSIGALIEAVSLLSMGLAGPSMLSARAYYERSLQFLYYKDHPVEWRSVVNYRSQPVLPGQVKKYLKDNFLNFEVRLKKLEQNSRRIHKDIYSVLSGVAHGTALNSISSAKHPSEIIETEAALEECCSALYSLAESISDIYISQFHGNWLSLPEEAKINLLLRFDPGTIKEELLF